MRKFLITASVIYSVFVASICKGIAAQPIAYFYCHGLGFSSTDASNVVRWFEHNGSPYYNERYIVDQPLISFNFPDVGKETYNKTEANFAQEQDIATVTSHYLKTVPSFYKKVVIFGHSRGAAAALEFVALHDRPEIAAIVASAPFDSIRSCIKNWVHNKVGYLSSSLAPCVDKTVAPWYFAKKYNPEGIQPIKVIHQIRPTIPILFVCTKEDVVVPYWSTLKLYQALIIAGHKHAYILILNKGAHSTMLQEEEGNIYESVVHAFYQRYNLPNDPEKAALGVTLLSDCQPALHELRSHFASVTV